MLSIYQSAITWMLVAFFLFPAYSYAQRGPIAVKAETVKSQAFAERIEALGTLRANESVELTSIVTEIVTAIHFEDGQRVKRGEVLLEMDSKEEQALRLEELSRVQDAQRQVNRLQSLVKLNTASQAALDEQKLALQTAQARMQAIEQQIQHRRLVAPFDGVVGLRNISVGALSRPGEVITTIDDDSVMKLDFSVPESFLSSIHRGLEITASASAWPNQNFQGEVFSISSRINPDTRSVQIRALIPNENSKLLPGMLMGVNLRKAPRDTLFIPEEALTIKGNKKMVWTISEREGKLFATSSAVTIGVRQQGIVEITQGLEAEQKIVTQGVLKLREGAEITIVESIVSGEGI